LVRIILWLAGTRLRAAAVHPGSDYARQRHQRQLIKAIVARAFSVDLLASPARFQAVISALASTLVFDGHGRAAVDVAFALRHLRANTITLAGLPAPASTAAARVLARRWTRCSPAISPRCA